MISIPLQNIAAVGSDVFLFARQADGSQAIRKDSTFKHYFYEPDPKGTFVSIDGVKCKKIVVNRPHLVRKQKSDDAYEGDVLFQKRYLIDNISEILPSIAKYLMIDIEVKCTELPHWSNPIFPITCIGIYNNYSREYVQWWHNDYKHLPDPESALLRDFIAYVKAEAPDIILGWNILDFDYPYMFARIKKLWDEDLGILLSPIDKGLYGRKIDEFSYPAGIAIIDFMDMFKKVYNKEPSNALDDVSHKYLETKLNKNYNFDTLDDSIPEKNQEDLQKMVGIEGKFHLISYYDEIRIMGKCEWADLTWNSKVLDVMVLSEAKRMGIVLPSKHYESEEFASPSYIPVADEMEFEGAYRRAELGRFENLHKVDLSSAYPQTIVDFCLDIANLTKSKHELKVEITDRETEEVLHSIYFKQNPNALLPTLARRLIAKKDYLKDYIKGIDPESKEGKDLAIKYMATKSLVNSLFGVCALKIFRLYKVEIASAITSIVRDLQHYVEKGLEKLGMKVKYVDTDACFIQANENPVEICNRLVKDWAKDRFEKTNALIEFDYEGVYESILVIAMCRYVGYLRNPKGKIKKEVKGVEGKRKDSSAFMAESQTEMIERILKGASYEEIVSFVNSEKERIKKVSLVEIGSPAKINESKKYKVIPIFKRAAEYAKSVANFEVGGNRFFWIYVNSTTQREKITNKTVKVNGVSEKRTVKTMVNMDVMAYDEEHCSHITEIDWFKVVERNITNKAEKIFEAMNWDIESILDAKPIKEKKVKAPKKAKKQKLEDSSATVCEIDPEEFCEQQGSNLDLAIDNLK